MLQDIRKNAQGTVAKVIVGLIVISFALFGIESILLGGSSNAIAEVNGEEIDPVELNQALNTQKRRLIAMMGENLDPSLLDDERLSGQVLDALISRKLLMQSAQEMKLAVSERELGSLISNMSEFQVDGKFSEDAYKSAVANAGYSPSYFKQSVRDDLIMNQLRGGLAGSEFATASELALNARIVAEQRDLRYVTIPRDGFLVDAQLAEESIEQFYRDNEVMFLTEESVDLEYIQLTLDDFREPVEEAAILEAYELARNDPAYKDQHRVSHILFEDAPGVEEKLAEAQEKLAAGAEFSEVAKQYSDDVGSAGFGGDLGYSYGDAFPPEIEQALPDLVVGAVSKPLQTDAGTHLVVVTERNAVNMPTLDEMREELEQSLQAEAARVVLLRTVESLKDLSFNAEDLAAPATELSLEVKQAAGVTRGEIDGLFSQVALVEAAFSEDVRDLGHNSEVIELANDNFVVLRVRRHNTPQLQDLASVREEIVAAINAENARQALLDEAERALTALRNGTSVEEFAVSEGYEWQVELGVDRRNRTVPPDILQRIFELPAPQEDSVSADVLVAANGDAVIVELVRVTQGDYDALNPAQQSQLGRQISGEYGGLIDNEFQRALRQDAEITIL